MKIKAKHIMRERISVGLEMTVKNIAHKFSACGQPGIPVVNDSQEVVGIVTEFDVLGAIREGLDLDAITAARIMTKDPVTADHETSADDLIQTMLLRNLTIVPIMRNGKYAGLVSRSTIVSTYLSPRFENFTSRERKGPFLCV